MDIRLLFSPPNKPRQSLGQIKKTTLWEFGSYMSWHPRTLYPSAALRLASLQRPQSSHAQPFPTYLTVFVIAAVIDVISVVACATVTVVEVPSANLLVASVTVN